MNNFKKKLMSLLLTLTLLLSCGFLPIGNKFSVNAVGDNAYPPYAGGIPTQVVYITDKAASLAEIYNGYIYGDIQNCLSDLGWNNVPINVYPVTGTQLINYIVGSQLNFQNAAIILELRNASLNKYYDVFDNLSLIEYLNVIIEIWQANDCRVMFINNTDETLFYGLNGFLSNVDIHINTDMFTVFADSIVSRLVDDNMVIKNYTILLDIPNSTDKFNNPFVKFLIHCLRHSKGVPDVIAAEYDFPPWYNYETKDISYINDVELLDLLNIRIFTYDEYFNNWENCINQQNSDPTTVIGVGCGYFGSNLTTWTNYLLGKFNGETPSFPVYYYRDSGLTQVEYNIFSSLPVPFLCCGWEIYLENKLPEILAEFLSGSSLDQYNNWLGICEVTHKTVEPGSGGWLNGYCRIRDLEIEELLLPE